MRKGGTGYWAIERTAIATAKLDRWLRRGQSALRGAAEGFFRGALDVDEATWLGLALYERAYRASERDLYEWERALFADLWPRPARLLVGGAGDGREAIALERAGHHVDAFEPVASIARRCRSRLGLGETVACSYEALAEAVLDGASNDASAIAARRYDGVVLGWGSFMHVLTARDRERTLRACDALCARGPIVASFWLARRKEPRRRSLELGRETGALIGRLRGRTPIDGELDFATHFGFAHPFTRDEIEAMAAQIGRNATWGGAEGYPHVVLAPAQR